MNMSGIKTACVVQGNIRRGTKEILTALADHFDVLILSTWKDDEPKLPKGEYEVVLNEFPECTGQAHRNYQRVSTNSGLKLAERLCCNYVLKWRTDMLPTKLDVNKLFEMSQYNVPQGFPSRIVTCDFRCMSVAPDWFSTISDFFAFGHIDMINMLWNVDGIDFQLQENPVEEMKRDLNIDAQWFRKDAQKAYGCFPPEAELYANLKSRLIKKTNRQLNHTIIAREYMFLLNYRKLGICWFAPENGFRPIGVIYRYPWWTESVWKGSKPFITSSEFPKKYLWRKIGRKLENFVRKRDSIEQQIWWNSYQHAKIPPLKKLAMLLKYRWLNTTSSILMKIWRALQIVEKP